MSNTVGLIGRRIARRIFRVSSLVDIATLAPTDGRRPACAMAGRTAAVA